MGAGQSLDALQEVWHTEETEERCPGHTTQCAVLFLLLLESVHTKHQLGR